MAEDIGKACRTVLDACEQALAIAEARRPGTWDDVMYSMRGAFAAAPVLIRAVNAHAALIANSHAIVALAGGWDEQGATGPRAPLSWETVGRMAIDYARAALINAYDLPSDTTPDQLRQVQAGVLIWRGDYWEMPPDNMKKRS